jgi:hypothetical protein
MELAGLSFKASLHTNHMWEFVVSAPRTNQGMHIVHEMQMAVSSQSLQSEQLA